MSCLILNACLIVFPARLFFEEVLTWEHLSMCQTHSDSHCGGCCRSFWSAGAAGEELQKDVLYELLKVLGARDNKIFSNTSVRSKLVACTCLQCLLEQLETACFLSYISCMRFWPLWNCRFPHLQLVQCHALLVSIVCYCAALSAVNTGFTDTPRLRADSCCSALI